MDGLQSAAEINMLSSPAELFSSTHSGEFLLSSLQREKVNGKINMFSKLPYLSVC